MTRSERAKIRTEIKRVIAAMEMSGERATSQDVCQKVLIESPEVLDEDTMRKLALREMQNIARSLMKSAVKDGSKTGLVFDLFGGEHGTIEMPKCIAIPVPGEREKVWGSTFKATLAELNDYVHSLYSGAKADIAKAKRVEAALSAFVEASDADEMDTTIEEILAMMRADRKKGGRA